MKKASELKGPAFFWEDNRISVSSFVSRIPRTAIEIQQKAPNV